MDHFDEENASLVVKNTFLEFVSASRDCAFTRGSRRRTSSGPPAVFAAARLSEANVAESSLESSSESSSEVAPSEPFIPAAAGDLQQHRTGRDAAENVCTDAAPAYATLGAIGQAAMPVAPETMLPMGACGYHAVPLAQPAALYQAFVAEAINNYMVGNFIQSVTQQFAQWSAFNGQYGVEHQIAQPTWAGTAHNGARAAQGTKMRRRQQHSACVEHCKVKAKVVEQPATLSRTPTPDFCSSSTDAGTDSDRKSETSSDEVDADSRTTVMLRNLPNNYSRDMLLGLLDEQGFAGLYDFLYLPMDFGSNASLGYAFVNLVSAEHVPRFWKTFEGFGNWCIPTKKHCRVSWSHPVQGLQANLERYRNSPVMHESVPDQYKPARFELGVRAPFPVPTKKLKLPRLRSMTVHS